ncbi:LuxR C-terminal-related transcriptional regulator [Streptomyces sp. 4503]|uniref:LuxR C-terminal-related transcriptional regulator n=1 Tax=Streptomyces niphimycinicus TaxID=2842201 RepID=A0ABS6CVN2_9ACTN|nr:helix-turn-helix transcriptional regulator [Streptomyces niphimycinicus]MBU3871012.1 LuxR C-terminal-related transcriptional regulator [Streptomyces niphimycinicus]
MREVAVTGSDGAVDVRSTLQRMRRRGGLPVAFGGLFSGSRQFRISELTGTTTNSLRGLAITPGNGLGGKVLTMSRPISVADYPTSRAISHEYDAAVGAERLRSMLAVPVVVRGRVRGVLYGALRQPLVLGDRALTSAMESARELERVLESELAQELAVREEAQRLLTEARQRRGQPPGPRWEPSAEETDPAVWEEVREAHGDLRALAHRVPDRKLREEILTVCSRLARASSGRGRQREHRSGRNGVELSPREVDVLACVASGATNSTAAERLGLRPETVKSYLRSSMRKLGAHTRLHAVVEARRAGLLP